MKERFESVIKSFQQYVYDPTISISLRGLIISKLNIDNEVITFSDHRSAVWYIDGEYLAIMFNYGEGEDEYIKIYTSIDKIMREFSLQQLGKDIPIEWDSSLL